MTITKLMDDTRWYVPKSVSIGHDYVREGACLFRSSDTLGNYNLADSKISRELLRGFVKVRDAESALGWCSKYGLPFGHGDVLIQDMLKLAGSVRWLLELHKLAVVDYLPFKIRELYLQIFSEKEIFEEFPDSSAFEFPHTASALSTDPNRIFVLMRGDRRLRGWNPCNVYTVYFNNAAIDLVELEDLWEDYDRRDIEVSADVFVILATLNYIAKAMNHHLMSINPKLEEMGGTLIPSLCARTPWQAITLAMYEEMSSAKNVGSCANPNCQRIFLRTRLDNIYCSRPGCRKWASRNRKRIGQADQLRTADGDPSKPI